MQLPDSQLDEDSLPTMPQRPNQAEGGFLQNMGRSFSKAGRRFITPLALVATIGGSVSQALAGPRHGGNSGVTTIASLDNTSQGRDETYGDLEAPAADTQGIADYFASHKNEISRNVTRHVSNQKTKKLILETIELIAANQSGDQFRVEKLSRAHGNSAAEFNGGMRTMFVSDSFDVRKVGDQAQLIHESIHSKQDDRLRAQVSQGGINVDTYRQFWNHGEVHTGEGVAVPEFEDEATAAQLEYLDSQLGGEISSIINGADTFAQARAKLNQSEQMRDAVPNKTTRTSIITKALFYFGDNANWRNLIRYIYECEAHESGNDGRSRFTPRLREIGQTSNEECDQIASQAGIQH